MNGRMAKRLWKMSGAILTGMNKPLGEGAGKYRRTDNAIRMEPVEGPDGKAYSKAVKAPGTIRTAWTRRIIYKALKRDWTRSNGQSILFKHIANGGIVNVQ